MNLACESAAPIAAFLVTENVPCVVLSGSDPKIAKDPIFDGAPVVRKPFETRVLIDAVVILASLDRRSDQRPGRNQACGSLARA